MQADENHGNLPVLPYVQRWKYNVNDDCRYIDETLAGNQAAFGQLVKTYQRRLYTTLYHLTRDHEESEDVVQETFVQAYTKLDTFQGRSSFYTWIYRIAFNQLASRRRRRRPQTSVDQAREDLGQEPVDSGETPLQEIERQERAVLVHQALNLIADDYRSILILREMDGMDYDSIADVLDLPIGTVRSRLHRARLQLKKQLEVLLETDQASSASDSSRDVATD